MPKKISNEEFYDDLIQINDFGSKDVHKDQLCPIYEGINKCSKRYEHNKNIDRGGSKNILKSHDAMTSRDVAFAELIDKDNPERSERFSVKFF